MDTKNVIAAISLSAAVISAMSISGFDDQFLFYGFLPKKEKLLENIFKKLQDLDYSIVFFIPASKINFYIPKFKKFFFTRKIMIAREMTKIHEEYVRNDIKLIKNLPENLKGELTVVISAKNKEKISEKKISESVKIEIKKMLKKYSHKDVVDFISKKENIQKKIVYNFCLQLIK